ncbi:hypothetical protein MHYP_G00199250 [Metynnis hypsauchen]
MVPHQSYLGRLFTPSAFTTLWRLTTTADILTNTHQSISLTQVHGIVQMYSIRCSRFLALAMVPIAIVSTLANLLLLFPDLDYRYLTEGHVTREAVWCTGIWLTGFVVLVAARGFASSHTKEGCCLFRTDMLCRTAYSCVAACAAGLCFVINEKGLNNGPLCLHNGTEGLEWERPLKRQKLE